MAPKRKLPPSRTTALPSSLRAELESLGHIPKKSASRKEKRKENRAKSGQANRDEHFANKKGKRQERDDDDDAGEGEEEEEEGGKKVRFEDEKEKEKPKQTPLEKLLAKQEGGGGGSSSSIYPKRKKSKVESVEDKEIAWLEAKLGAKSKGKWKDEMVDDGLDDLFDGLGDLEDAVFGNPDKDYSKLLKSEGDGSPLLEEDEHSNEEEDSDEDDEDPTGENGVSDEELFDPSDDDDHSEFGEIQDPQPAQSEGREEATFDPRSNSDEEDEEEQSGSEEEEEDDDLKGMTETEKKQIKFAAEFEAAETPAPTPGRYVPPHLRPSSASFSAPTQTAPTPSLPPSDPRLRRLLQGHLNKLSPLNLSPILTAILTLYDSHPRALVSTELTSLLVGIMTTRDNIGEGLVVVYAALVCAVGKMVGLEFWAGVIGLSVKSLDEARKKFNEDAGEEGGFEGRGGSKEAENLVAFLSEIYNFGVVACVLIYDLTKSFVLDGVGMGELETELLVKVVKRSGQQLRQDDPSALKEIIGMVKIKMQGVDPTTMNSRTKFMVESLTNLKNNKIKHTGDGNTVDHYSGLKKYLSGLKKGGSSPDPLRLSLSDIRSSTSKGKWWIVGAAWGGDPLVDAATKLKNEPASSATKSGEEEMLIKLAKKQGMNTDVRKAIFGVLMSSEDYVDACERLLQLGLTDVQQREIARVLLQCCGNEKTYNPYYTLVASRFAAQSHSFQITLQYCLWDFFRELGEKTVGGEEMVKNLAEDDSRSSGKVKVVERRVTNLAKLYAWCVAKDVLSLVILKPVPFNRARPQTISFLRQFLSALLISSQAASPALVLNPATSRRDREALEKVFVKAAPHGALVKGILGFFENVMQDADEDVKGEQEKQVLKWGTKVALDTMGLGGSFVDVR